MSRNNVQGKIEWKLVQVQSLINFLNPGITSWQEEEVKECVGKN